MEHYGDENAFDEETIYFLKATEKGQIIGFIRMGIESGVAFIYSLLVKADQQGKGIGEKLIP